MSGFDRTLARQGGHYAGMRKLLVALARGELRNVEILAIIGIVHSRVGRVAGFR
jgi:hypothetical protein